MKLSKKAKAFVSWSGGKDCCLAMHKARDAEPLVLLNMATEDAGRSMTHGLSSTALRLQSDCIGLPLIQQTTTWNTYERNFKDVAGRLKKEGIEAGIFGDIDLEEHRTWIERVCADIGIEPIFPLWHKDRSSLLEELISSGFKAIVVTAKMDMISEKYLGRPVDPSFVEYVKEIAIDINGENGEYHTFVIDGPLFKKKIEIAKGQIIYKDGYMFYDMVELITKKKEIAANE